MTNPMPSLWCTDSQQQTTAPTAVGQVPVYQGTSQVVWKAGGGTSVELHDISIAASDLAVGDLP